MSTKTKPPALSVEDATKARDAATKRLDDLTKQLTNGDADVSADELADARTAAEHAELALRGARSRAQRETEERFKANLDTFTNAWPKRLEKKRDKVEPARTEALDKLAKLHAAVSDVESTRTAIHAEWNAMRPEDVPLDAKDQLPEHYKQAKPTIHSTPADDPAATVLSAAVETIKKAGVHNLDRDIIRLIEQHCGGVKYRRPPNRPRES